MGISGVVTNRNHRKVVKDQKRSASISKCKTGATVFGDVLYLSHVCSTRLSKHLLRKTSHLSLSLYYKGFVLSSHLSPSVSSVFRTIPQSYTKLSRLRFRMLCHTTTTLICWGSIPFSNFPFKDLQKNTVPFLKLTLYLSGNSKMIFVTSKQFSSLPFWCSQSFQKGLLFSKTRTSVNIIPSINISQYTHRREDGKSDDII